MALLALDFDGVICDSAAETAASAWRCAQQIWPELFPGTDAPPETIAAFCQIRPFLETGYQSILMLKMLQEKLALTAFSEHLNEHLARLMQEINLGPAELKRLFGDCRDHWIEHDNTSWLQTHRFYPGVIEALGQALAKKQLAIITTKQQRFVKLLLAGQNIDFPEEQIWGLEQQPKKEVVLKKFLSAGQREIIFIEDRLPTLELVDSLPALDSIQLLYATWGYGTSAEHRRCLQSSRIKSLNLPDFISLLAV